MYGAPMTPAEIALAKERGRQKSLAAILSDPAARLRVEMRYGIAFCRRKWPEAYGLSTRTVSDWFRSTFGVGAFKRA